MTKEQFFDWLSGYFDICEPDRIGVVETQIIKDHIGLVRGIEALPPRMAEEDVEKFFAGLPSPSKTLESAGNGEGINHNGLNYSLESLSNEIKKSSGGRVRPTIDAPPPPPLQSKQVMNPTTWTKLAPRNSPSSNIIVC